MKLSSAARRVKPLENLFETLDANDTKPPNVLPTKLATPVARPLPPSSGPSTNPSIGL